MTCFLLKKVLILLYNPLIISIFTSVKKRQAMDEKAILLKTIEGLNASIASLSATNKKQAEQNEKLQARIKELTAQVAWLNRQLLGRKSENFAYMILICQTSLPTSFPASGSRRKKSGTRLWTRLRRNRWKT